MRTSTLPEWFSLKHIGILLVALAVAALLAVGLVSPGSHGAVLAQVGTPTPTPTPGPGICDRTQKVQDAILAKLPDVTFCGDVTDSDLSNITGTLEIYDLGMTPQYMVVTELDPGDLDGLSRLTKLVFSDEKPGLTPSDTKITSIHQDTFDELTGLQELSIDLAEVTSLPEDVFEDLTALTTLKINMAGLTSLDEDIFDDLTGLDEMALNLPELSSLHQDTFDGLTSLKELSIDLPEVTSLHEDVFEDLTALTTLDVTMAGLTSLDEDVFEHLTALTTLDVTMAGLTSLDEDVF